MNALVSFQGDLLRRGYVCGCGGNVLFTIHLASPKHQLGRNHSDSGLQVSGEYLCRLCYFNFSSSKTHPSYFILDIQAQRPS